MFSRAFSVKWEKFTIENQNQLEGRYESFLTLEFQGKLSCELCFASRGHLMGVFALTLKSDLTSF